MSKKSAPKKLVKKVSKPKTKITPEVTKLEVKLVSYTIQAMIPTMMYGNITPRITVEARTMEDAKRAVMPHIEELFAVYLEEPRDGKPARFMKKAEVSATERKVEPKAVATAPAVKKEEATPAPAPVKKEEEEKEKEPEVAKTPAYEKAAKAIESAMSTDALGLIEDQIQASVKLSADEKPMLLELVLKKRKTLN